MAAQAGMMVGPIADKTRAKGNWPLHEGSKCMTVATLESVGCQSQLEPMKTAEAAFQQAYPAYAATRQLDALRASQYSRLDRLGHVYLDYTGGGLYADCQLRDHLAWLAKASSATPTPKT